MSSFSLSFLLFLRFIALTLPSFFLLFFSFFFFFSLYLSILLLASSIFLSSLLSFLLPFLFTFPSFPFPLQSFCLLFFSFFFFPSTFLSFSKSLLFYIPNLPFLILHFLSPHSFFRLPSSTPSFSFHRFVHKLSFILFTSSLSLPHFFSTLPLLSLTFPPFPLFPITSSFFPSIFLHSCNPFSLTHSLFIVPSSYFAYISFSSISPSISSHFVSSSF